MHIEGGCHCGRISYKAEVDPATVSICHCNDCQQLTGTAFRVTVPAREENLELTGEPTIYVKVAESGNKRAQAFCGHCGSQIYATSVGEGPKVYGLRVGTSKQRRELTPRKQVWCEAALDWLPTIGGIPAVQKQS